MADDSHEISIHVFSEKYKKKMSSATVVIGAEGLNEAIVHLELFRHNSRLSNELVVNILEGCVFSLLSWTHDLNIVDWTIEPQFRRMDNVFK